MSWSPARFKKLRLPGLCDCMLLLIDEAPQFPCQIKHLLDSLSEIRWYLISSLFFFNFACIKKQGENSNCDKFILLFFVCFFCTLTCTPKTRTSSTSTSSSVCLCVLLFQPCLTSSALTHTLFPAALHTKKNTFHFNVTATHKVICHLIMTKQTRRHFTVSCECTKKVCERKCEGSLVLFF